VFKIPLKVAYTKERERTDFRDGDEKKIQFLDKPSGRAITTRIHIILP
jgi:hypothetical protein